ncbi:GIY-YIG nuclease family protein [Streptomyces sp. NPDC005775]|uniref:GIY-YIG nuclease family protein n=1 Tax=Streptomyces sp. NPDC005775 TaxID=3364729 RepID=UPI0036967228
MSKEAISLAERLGGDVGKSIAATLHHVELLREKEAKLEAARHEAEAQVMHRVGAAFRLGEIDHYQLVAVYEHYKAMGLTGRMHRWDEHVDISWKVMTHLSRQLPNGPEDSWVGEYPFHEATSAPAKGIAVVYVLFDDLNAPCYVGSTDQFRTRVAYHRRHGKQFVSWQAHPCRDREHAYELEDRLLRRHKPPLNQKASR